MIRKANLILTNFLNEEKLSTYLFNERFTFNKNLITNLTVTDHYQKKQGRENINDGIIIELIWQLNELIVPPRKKLEKRDIYVVDWLTLNDKQYRLIDYLDVSQLVNNPSSQFVLNQFNKLQAELLKILTVDEIKLLLENNHSCRNNPQTEYTEIVEEASNAQWVPTSNNSQQLITTRNPEWRG